MKTILLLLAGAIGASAQTPPASVWVSIYVEGVRIMWYRLGPTLQVANGQIDVALPPAPVRVTGAVLSWDANAKGWRIPADATQVKLFVNGLRFSAADFSLTGGLIQAKADNMQPGFVVIADYEMPAR
jgi:hypothetical protein